MSNVHHHPPHPGKEKSELRKVISACIWPVCWMLLGAAAYFYKTDLSKLAGLFLIFVGVVSLVYNLLRVNKRRAEKKKSLHM